ncbi:MAG: hypothetical protein AMJ60_05225 [Desulfobacterales bacterium SG8_35]|nr:MAG: hypothetical protein AMJ60_05225 [Desulfobacterales bacterium SG8_35]
MIKNIIPVLIAACCILSGKDCLADQTIVAGKVSAAPVIDGIDNDQAWQDVKPLVTRDTLAGIDIHLKAVYTDKEIFFLVRFPDPDESRSHKSWQWDAERNLYDLGKDREDTFIFKWDMEATPVDLSIYADNNYTADIWYWKANRTDPSGHADDKSHVFNSIESKNATRLISRTGRTMYLSRLEDNGRSAYKSLVPTVFEGKTMPRFESRQPTASRADVRAKGVWKDGWWTIELARVLDTGFADDIQFSTAKSFEFGVSRYEIAGREPDQESNQPLHGAGDVGEALTLILR